MPIRKPRQIGKNIIGSFPSLKMPGKRVKFESTIERDLLFFLEHDPAVLSYEEQPFRISITKDDGKHQSYVPDFLVVRKNAKELVECKPADRLEHRSTKRQIAIGERWAAENDHEFIVITDMDLRTGPKLDNLRILWRYARSSVPYNVTERVLMRLKHQPRGVTLGDLAAYSESKPGSMAHAHYFYNLLFWHVLAADLSQPLSPASLIWLPQKTHS